MLDVTARRTSTLVRNAKLAIKTVTLERAPPEPAARAEPGPASIELSASLPDHPPAFDSPRLLERTTASGASPAPSCRSIRPARATLAGRSVSASSKARSRATRAHASVRPAPRPRRRAPRCCTPVSRSASASQRGSASQCPCACRALSGRARLQDTAARHCPSSTLPAQGLDANAAAARLTESAVPGRSRHGTV